MIFIRDYKIRVIIVFCAFFILYLILGIRLFLLQVLHKDFFNILARQQHQVTMTINPPRGLIFDRTSSVALALNQEVISAFILPHQFKEAEKAKKFLQRHFPDVWERINAYPERHFLWLERHVSADRHAWLKKELSEDVSFVSESKRFYPFESCAHLLGFTDIDNKGIAGLELEFDQKLHGKSTQVTIERDARSGNFYFERTVDNLGEQGASVTLSLDSRLQFLAFEELKKSVDDLQAKLGSVLVMDPDSGEILAMTTYPTFDPNQKAIPSLEITKNNVVCECYELGSVVKAFSALAALDEEVVTLDEEIDCEGKISAIDRFKVENWKSFGVLSFHDVVRFSSNIGTAKIIKRVGKRLYDHFRRVGFGTKTGIEFPGERDGFVNPPKNWSKSSIIVLSFGYETMISLLQLGRAMSIFANGGHLVKPTLFKVDHTPVVQKKSLYKRESLEGMRTILESIGERYAIPGCRVLGKTGSARCAEQGGYSEKRGLYTFSGIVEKGDYRRVIITFIREPEKKVRWASQVAAPLFQSIAERMVMLDLMRR